MGLHYCELCDFDGPELYRGEHAITLDVCATSCGCYECLCEDHAVDMDLECAECLESLGCDKCFQVVAG